MHLKDLTCENDVKREIRKLFKSYRCYDRASPAGHFSKHGVPDRHACCRGWFIGVEAKYGGNGLSVPQAKDLKEISAAGGIALVIDEKTLEVLEDVLRDVRDGNAGVDDAWWFSLPQHTPGYLEAKK